MFLMFELTLVSEARVYYQPFSTARSSQVIPVQVELRAEMVMHAQLNG